jgi:hypothetical protein
MSSAFECAQLINVECDEARTAQEVSTNDKSIYITTHRKNYKLLRFSLVLLIAIMAGKQTVSAIRRNP